MCCSQLCSHCGWLLLKCSAIGIGFNGAETNCRIAHILGILLMNSCNTDRFLATTVVYGLSSLYSIHSLALRQCILEVKVFVKNLSLVLRVNRDYLEARSLNIFLLFCLFVFSSKNTTRNPLSGNVSACCGLGLCMRAHTELRDEQDQL